MTTPASYAAALAMTNCVFSQLMLICTHSKDQLSKPDLKTVFQCMLY